MTVAQSGQLRHAISRRPDERAGNTLWSAVEHYGALPRDSALAQFEMNPASPYLDFRGLTAAIVVAVIGSAPKKQDRRSVTAASAERLEGRSRTMPKTAWAP